MGRSYVSLGKTKTEPNLYGINMKTGKKVRKNAKKSFLIKKFMATTSDISSKKETL